MKVIYQFQLGIEFRLVFFMFMGVENLESKECCQISLEVTATLWFLFGTLGS